MYQGEDLYLFRRKQLTLKHPYRNYQTENLWSTNLRKICHCVSPCLFVCILYVLCLIKCNRFRNVETLSYVWRKMPAYLHGSFILLTHSFPFSICFYPYRVIQIVMSDRNQILFRFYDNGVNTCGLLLFSSPSPKVMCSVQFLLGQKGWAHPWTTQLCVFPQKPRAELDKWA